MNPPENAYPQRPWLVETIIKERSFTLLGGSAAAGKSTLACQGIHEWLTAKTFLGFQCHRTPKFWYLAFDRLIESIHDQLESMGIFFDGFVDIQSHAMLDLTNDNFNLPQIPQGGVLVLDGLDFLVRGGQINEFRAVAKLCRKCVQLIRSTDVSIIGIVGANKTSKNGQDESNPFDALSGSGVWQRVSDTNMVIRVYDPSATDCDKRTLYVRPRLSKAFKKFYQFQDNGWMAEIADPAATAKSIKNPQGLLYSLPDFRHFKLEEAIKIGKDLLQVSEKTVRTYINILVEGKSLEWISHGTYRKKTIQN